MNTILTKDNVPFKSEHAARIQAGRFHLKEFTIVPNGTGYAIQTEEEIQRAAPAVDVKAVSPAGAEVEAPKHRVTQPWKPATLLDIPSHLKNPNYVYRFCDKKRDGNLDKKIAEGWEVDKELSKKMRQGRPTVDDGAALDGTIGIRELIVMRMTKETAEARRKYYAAKTDGLMEKNAAQLKQDLQSAAGEYEADPERGSITVETY